MRILAAATAVGLIVLAAYLLFSGEARRPSVLLVTIDTLRADALTGEDTPSMLGLSGVRFLRARTPVPHVETDVVEVAGFQAGGRQAVVDGVLRKLGIVLAACESLFLRRGHDLAVYYKSGS